MDALQRARELYEKIDFSRIIVLECPGTYEIGDMTCKVEFRNDKVEVLNCNIPANGKVAVHTNTQVEHYLLYEGDCTVNINHDKIFLQPSLSPHTPPLTPHSLSSEKGCRLLIARIPPTEGIY